MADEKKICFIMCASDPMLAEECIKYIRMLDVPEGFEVDVEQVCGAASMASGYNEAMRRTDAKYKVYLHQDVLLVYRGFLKEMLRLFTAHPEVGVMGVVGNKSLAEDGCPWSDGMHRRMGEAYVDLVWTKQHAVLSRAKRGDYRKAVVLDGLLMATQYDLPWRDDLFQGWDFYDCSQSLEFRKAGYEAAVPRMKEPWCLHDNDILHMEDYDKWRQVFLQEYGEYIGEYMQQQPGRRAVYQYFMEGQSRLPFPYPPVYTEKNVDYLCFTDREDVSSKFWRIVRVKGRDDACAERMLSKYTDVKEIRTNQIQTGPLFSGDGSGLEPLSEVPALHELPEVDFDEKTLVPTADENGHYRFRKNPVYKGGRYGGRKLLLTIGVPVSNQAGTIDRCLRQIKPLLDELDAELLVINTGSTDGTLDICRKYNARIIEFPWCDNMSAVRNEGIYHALGEWYLSIDDDEWFEDVSDILRFFQSGEYQRYDAAYYTQRNYLYHDVGAFIDMHVLRTARITPDLHFEGRIHDALVCPPKGRGTYLAACANHYGFSRDGGNELRKKYVRNVSILLYDVYEYPLDLRYNYQLANELNCGRYFMGAVPFYLRGISMEREIPNEHSGKMHIAGLLSTLSNACAPELFPMTELVSGMHRFSAVEKALFHYNLADKGILLSRDPKEALEHYLKYVEYREEYQKDPARSAARSIMGLHVCNSRPYIVRSHVIAFCAYSRLGMAEDAARELAQAEPDGIFDLRECLMQEICGAQPEVFRAVSENMTLLQKHLWAGEILARLLAAAGAAWTAAEDAKKAAGQFAAGQSGAGQFAAGQSGAGQFAAGQSDAVRFAEAQSVAVRYIEAQSAAGQSAAVRFTEARYAEAQSAAVQFEKISVLLREMSVREADRFLDGAWHSLTQASRDAAAAYGMQLSPAGSLAGRPQEDMLPAGRLQEDMSLAGLSLTELYFYAGAVQMGWMQAEAAWERLELFLQYMELNGNFCARYYSTEVLNNMQNPAIPPQMRAAYLIFEAFQGTEVRDGTVEALRQALVLYPGYRQEIGMLAEQLGFME